MQKTYWHLVQNQKLPSTYEIVSSRLLYYPDQGIEIDTPVKAWYKKYQSRINPDVLENFYDPSEMTYSKYVHLRTESSYFTENIFSLIESGQVNKPLVSEWKTLLERLIPVLRFPLHGLQMSASYIAQMVPSSRLTIPFMFQAADEMAWIQILCVRIAQLQAQEPQFGRSAREEWQENPYWQPLRKAVESLLITYDWLDAFCSLNLVLKPLMREIFIRQFSKKALDHGDYHWCDLLSECEAHSLWHSQISDSLLGLLQHHTPAIYQELMQDKITRKNPLEDFYLTDPAFNNVL